MTLYNNHKSFCSDDISSSYFSYNIDNESAFYPVFVIVTDINNNFCIKYASLFLESLGYSCDDIVLSAKSISDIMPESEFTYFKSIIQRHISINLTEFFCEISLLDINNNVINCCVHITLDENNYNFAECLFVNMYSCKDYKNERRRISYTISYDDITFISHKVCHSNKLELCYASDSISYYGFNKKRLIDDKRNIFRYLSQDDYQTSISIFKDFKNRTREFSADAVRLDSGNNEPSWVLFQSFAHYDNDNNLTYIDSVITNISEQKAYYDQFKTSQSNLKKNLKHSQFISDVLQSLQTTENYQLSINTILQKLSDFLSLSFVFLSTPYSNSGNLITYRYFRKDNEFSQSIIPVKKMYDNYPKIMERLNKYGTAYKDKYGVSKDCLNEFLIAGDNSYLVYSIPAGGDNCGYILLCDYDNERSWDNETISIITDISQILSNLFMKYIAQLEVSTTLETFKTVLDNIDSYVCVSTINNDDIIFANKKFLDNFDSEALGKHLWDCLGITQNEIDKLFYNKNNWDEKQRPRFFELFSPNTNQWIDITQIFIIWVDGRIVKLSTLNNITQKIEYEKLIELQAMVDHLTTLPNRRMLEKDFQELVDKSILENSYGYVLFLDLDNFKNINDGLGHHYGDVLLQTISIFLKSLPFTGKYTYRFGGDEFILLVPYEYKDHIDSIVNTLLDRFRQKWDIVDTTYFCTMSMGIVKYPHNGTTLLEILKKVDMTMYNAKKQGKNRALFYKSKIASDSVRNIEIERYMRESVSNSCNGFMVYYQPIINTYTKEVSGAEALLRWSCENLGMIAPAEFIPIAENLGSIIPLGEFVIDNACKQCRKMMDSGFPNFKMSINLSVCQLFEENFVDSVKAIIEKNNVPFSNIIFEITESLAINDFKETRRVLKKISELGIQISLDDFGTGYSSLNNIKEMPLNTIKIDKSFIDDLVNSTNTEIFVKTIITLAHELNMKVCAEGVELESQYNILLSLETDMIQGYYFGKPVPSDKFESQFAPVTL